MKKMKMTIFKNVGVSEIDVIILHCAFFYVHTSCVWFYMRPEINEHTLKSSS